jgi:hypothetical protein
MGYKEGVSRILETVRTVKERRGKSRTLSYGRDIEKQRKNFKIGSENKYSVLVLLKSMARRTSREEFSATRRFNNGFTRTDHWTLS